MDVTGGSDLQRDPRSSFGNNQIILPKAKSIFLFMALGMEQNSEKHVLGEHHGGVVAAGRLGGAGVEARPALSVRHRWREALRAAIQKVFGERAEV
jgi:hypothetical protein